MEKLTREQLKKIGGQIGSLAGCAAYCGDSENGFTLVCKGTNCTATDQEGCESDVEIKTCEDDNPNGGAISTIGSF